MVDDASCHLSCYCYFIHFSFFLCLLFFHKCVNDSKCKILYFVNRMTIMWRDVKEVSLADVWAAEW